jgi:hypothetical protein
VPSLPTLRALTTNTLRDLLREHAPPYLTFRFERIAIRRPFRSVALSDLPMPAPLRKAVSAGGRKRLGDLDGLTYSEVLGAKVSHNEAMRQLHGLLRILGAAAPARRPKVPVPSRAELARPFARAIDVALNALPAPRRRALELRYGARGRPIRIGDIAAREGLGQVDPHRLLDRWTERLGLDAGPAVARAREQLRVFVESRSAVLTSDEVDALLGITRSRPRYGRDFYLRLLSRLKPRKTFIVTWGKRVPRARPAPRRRRGRSR